MDLPTTKDDEWAVFTHPEPDEEDPPTFEEIQVLREFVERYGTLHAIPADDAARRLMSLVNENRDSEVVDKGERVAWLLWDAGIEMPRYQPAILDLVEAIQALPTLEMTEEQIRTWQFKEKWERWRNMEKFWDIWFETYQRYWEFRYPSDSFDGEGFAGFPNANAFNAHYLVAHPPGLSCPNELTRAFRHIIFTLEQDPWNHPPQWITQTTSPPTPSPCNQDWYIAMLNTNVHGLVPFFEIAGDIIYNFIDKEDLSRFNSIKHSDSDLWKGDTKFTKDRWDFWKERLRWISEQSELKQRTRDEARMLVQLLQNIEERKT